MEEREHKIKHPKDLTGRCPLCDNDLKEMHERGYCFCKFCRV